jgi:hypothetical protein
MTILPHVDQWVDASAAEAIAAIAMNGKETSTRTLR